jgi:hypothetical protein
MTGPDSASGYRTTFWPPVKGLALDVNEYLRQRGIAAKPVSVRLSWWCCVVGILGWTVGLIPVVDSLLCIVDTVLMLIQMSQLRDASMAIATMACPGLETARILRDARPRHSV